MAGGFILALVFPHTASVCLLLLPPAVAAEDGQPLSLVAFRDPKAEDGSLSLREDATGLSWRDETRVRAQGGLAAALLGVTGWRTHRLAHCRASLGPWSPERGHGVLERTLSWEFDHQAPVLM